MRPHVHLSKARLPSPTSHRASALCNPSAELGPPGRSKAGYTLLLRRPLSTP
ncbi:hypothetical protein PABY_05870 [Pyrodictium abyssi]|uniref:Uncharacterized protein n=1 Tax=Pyrodictium abyssi TaxID=54256 RepID=A0ABN6ZRJ1_9CREN|nr:hypothetical protein PABY_05870 [Pyrodictium abyssi]